MVPRRQPDPCAFVFTLHGAVGGGVAIGDRSREARWRAAVDRPVLGSRVKGIWPRPFRRRARPPEARHFVRNRGRIRNPCRANGGPRHRSGAEARGRRLPGWRAAHSLAEGAGGGRIRSRRCFCRCVLCRLPRRRNSGRGGRQSRGRGIRRSDQGRGAAKLNNLLRISVEVAEALARGHPVVALETSIVGQGLPAPHNLRAARGCEAAIRKEGAVPAAIGVLDGQIVVGLSDAELQRIASGATTVAATMRAAEMAGIRCFATGGIGGVHRGNPEDQSADLVELGRTSVAVFCAGAKIVLDLPHTLERLESLSVPLLGYGCDELPAFYTRHSGCRAPTRVDRPEETAAVLRAAWATGSRGVVVAIPPPGELEGAEEIVLQATRDLADVVGPEVTPRLLARMAELSGGRSTELNVELVVNNARVAARVARLLAG